MTKKYKRRSPERSPFHDWKNHVSVRTYSPKTASCLKWVLLSEGAGWLLQNVFWPLWVPAFSCKSFCKAAECLGFPGFTATRCFARHRIEEDSASPIRGHVRPRLAQCSRTPRPSLQECIPRCCQLAVIREKTCALMLGDLFDSSTSTRRRNRVKNEPGPARHATVI